MTAYVLHVKDGGQQITVSGWKSNPYEWKKGDYLILERESGETTRYQLDELEVPHDPGDQYFARCSFAPRTA